MKNIFILVALAITANAQENLVVYYNFNLPTPFNDLSDYDHDGVKIGSAHADYGWLLIPNDSVSALVVPAESFNGLNDFTIIFESFFEHEHTNNNNTVLSASRYDCLNCFGVAYSNPDTSWVITMNESDHLFYDKGTYKEQITIMRDAGLVSVKAGNQNLGSFYESSVINIASLQLGQEDGCVGGCFVVPNNLAGGIDIFKIYSTAIYCTDTLEPNDIITESSPILTNKTYAANISYSDSADWFKFIIDTLHNARMRLFNLPENYNMKLYDSTYSLIKNSNNQGLHPDTIIANELPSGTYFLKVFLGNSNMCYSLIVETSDSSWISIPTGNEFTITESGLSFFPNPSSLSFYLNYSLTESSNLTIADAFGRIVKQLTLDPSSNNITISTGDLTDGVYLMSLNDGAKRISKKLIVAK